MKTIRIPQYPYYISQRGHGLGGIFRSLARVFMPIAKTVFKASKPLMKKAVKYAGKEALQVGLDTVTDVVNGNDLKTSLKKNVKTRSRHVLNKTKDKIKEGLQKVIKGAGKKRKHQFKSSTRKKRAKKMKTIFD